MARRTVKDQLMPPLAGALAWLVPGVGHVLLGRYIRGLILFVTIAATFWTGVAMGGVNTVDPDAERWWFMAQMGTGVHGLIAWQRQQRVYGEVVAEVRQREPHVDRMPLPLRQQHVDAAMAARGLALVSPMDTPARTYAGVAGMLNILCVFDAIVLALMGRRGEGIVQTSAGKPA